MEHQNQEFEKLREMLSKHEPDRQAECPDMNWSLYVMLDEVIINNNEGILWHYREDWCQECQKYHPVLRCLEEGQGHDLPVVAVIAARNTLHKQMAENGHDGDNV